MSWNARSLTRQSLRHPSIAKPGSLEWRLPKFAGRLIEVSGDGDTAVLTLACSLIKDAQSRAEPTAWIARADSTFFPPDAADSGVDLQALIVVRSQTPRLAARAADWLLRSAAFGLVIIDLGKDADVPLPLLARLSGLARRHHTAVLFLTEKGATVASLGPLISVAAHTRRERLTGDRFRCSLYVTKDKHGAPWSEHHEECRGPSGLR